MNKVLSSVLVFSIAFVTSLATAKPPAKGNINPKTFEQTVARAITYLRDQGQAKDGSYSSFAGIGPTALITTALMRHGRTPEDPQIARSLKYLQSFVQKDGGIHQKGTFYRNYETSLAIMCFAEANKGGRYDDTIKRADKFVKGIQWADEEDKDASDPAYGGGGYGKDKRPDLSNTSFLIDALRSAGVDLRLTLSKFGISVQHDQVFRKSKRWRFLLHSRR